MDRFALISGFDRKKDKISNEWMIQLYFVSLRSESEVKKNSTAITCERSIQNHIIFYIKIVKYILYVGPN